MRAGVWTVAGLAVAGGITAGGWYAAAGPGEVTAAAVCDSTADLSTDVGVASAARGIAVVEAVRNVRYQDDESTRPGAFLTTEVRVLRTLKGRFPATLPLTQSVRQGGTPGRYVSREPERNAVLEPGRQYVVAVRFGSTMAEPGTEAWVAYAQPVRRGVEGEVAHWKQAVAQAPQAAAPAVCDDVSTVD
ncbi:hypothetical protein OG625_01595 [Streptomyces sp. NBC_01351]|uniref:hypothetical protein n=1 Tax=Streptomyces sp. NBC_01351 TaxID=2903833 RepID=UPI002E341A36|nr:hypothetical protein [Streptomyces sp. NBC_01351]